MCIALSILDNGHFARCRECWQCKDRKVSDWVGRCTAEAESATKVDCLTLTYGPDEHGNKNHLASQLLVYEDFQKFVRHLRDAGYPVRFFVVGEYGTDKGRSHWHAILFWQAEPYKWPEPPMRGGPRDLRRWAKCWPHGHLYLDENPRQLKAVRYACKYIQKGETHQIKMGYSTKPALGAYYFRQMAEDYVRAGNAPQSAVYKFKEHRIAPGRGLKRYYMHKGAFDQFIKHFIKVWHQERPGQFMPVSQPVEEYLDRAAADQLFDAEMDDYQRNYEKPVEAYLERLERQREERYQADVKAEKKAEQLGVTIAEYNELQKIAAQRPKPPPRRHPIGVGSDEAWSLHTKDTLGIRELKARRP